MRTAATVFGLLAAVVSGAVVLFTVGETAAIVTFLAILGGTLYATAAASADGVRRFVVVAVTALVAGTGLAAWQTAVIVHALTGTDGPADTPDPASLASALHEIARVGGASDFVLELTEAEVEAIVQSSIGDGSPLARVRVDAVDGDGTETGTLHLTGEFKRGSVTAHGVATVEVRSGVIEVRLDAVRLGLVTLPALTRAAVADLVNSIADLNAALVSTGAHVESVHVGEGHIVVIGVKA